MSGPLKNKRHERFCQELVSGKSQAEAYRLAGYKPDDGHAARLAVNGKVMERTAELAQVVLDKYHVTNDRIIRAMATRGFSNIKNYADLMDHGDLRQVDDDEATAIGEFTVETYMDGRGEDARPVKRVRVKMVDAMAPLSHLAKIHGLMKDDGGSANSFTLIIDLGGSR